MPEFFIAARTDLRTNADDKAEEQPRTMRSERISLSLFLSLSLSRSFSFSPDDRSAVFAVCAISLIFKREGR